MKKKLLKIIKIPFVIIFFLYNIYHISLKLFIKCASKVIKFILRQIEKIIKYSKTLLRLPNQKHTFFNEPEKIYYRFKESTFSKFIKLFATFFVIFTLISLIFHSVISSKGMKNIYNKNYKTSKPNAKKYNILKITDTSIDKIDILKLSKELEKKNTKALFFDQTYSMASNDVRFIYKYLEILKIAKKNKKLTIFSYNPNYVNSKGYLVGGFFDIIFIKSYSNSEKFGLKNEFSFYSTKDFLKNKKIISHVISSGNLKHYAKSNDIKYSNEYYQTMYNFSTEYNKIFLKNISNKRKIKYTDILKILNNSITVKEALAMNIIDGFGEIYDLERYLINHKLTSEEVEFIDISENILNEKESSNTKNENQSLLKLVENILSLIVKAILGFIAKIINSYFL